MKPAQRKAFFQDLKDRGYVEHKDVFYPPTQAAALGLDKPVKKKRAKYNRTGDIYDDLNIKHKAEIKDMFTMLMEKLDINIWPEFLFLKDRRYAFDYAIPDYKIAIEQNGGIHMKGNSGHSSGVGIQRDMDKTAAAASEGWVVISRSPDQMMTQETIDLIRKVISTRTLIS